MTKSAEEKINDDLFRFDIENYIKTYWPLADKSTKAIIHLTARYVRIKYAPQPKEQPAGEWETRKLPLSGTWAVMHRKEGFTTDFDLYYATSQPAANRLKSLLNASEGDREELRSKDAEIERLRGALQKIIDYPIYNRSWVSDVGEIKDIAYSATQFKNQKEGR